MKSNKKEKHHHRIVPIIFIVLGAPVAAFGLFLLVANALTNDNIKTDDSSLTLPTLHINEQDNGYTLLKPYLALDAVPTVDPKVDDMIGGGAFDAALAQQTVTTQREKIDAFLAAAQKPIFQDPFYEQPSKLNYQNSLPNNVSIGQLRDIGKFVAVEALLKSHQGNTDGALQESLAVVRLGNHMQQGYQSLISYLVGVATSQIGLQTMRSIALAGDVTSSTSLQLNEQLAALPDTREAVANAMKFEYMIGKTVFSSVTTLSQLYPLYNVSVDVNGKQTAPAGEGFLQALDATGVTRYYFQPNHNAANFVADAEHRVLLAEEDCASYVSNEYHPLRLQHHGLGMLFEANAVGKFLTDIGTVSFGGLNERRCNEKLAIDGTILTIALRAYHHDHQAWPEKLTDLVPTYLSSVPTDPYSGQSMHWSTPKLSVYSVGLDHRDQGGDMSIDDSVGRTRYSGGDWQNMRDPSFVVE